MIKSVVQLKNVQMPFAVENVSDRRGSTCRTEAYPDSAASIRFFEQLLPRLQSVPGVEAATCRTACRRPATASIPCQSPARRTRRRATIRWPARASSRPAISTRSRPGCCAAASSRRPTRRRASRWPSSTRRSRGRTSRHRIRSAASSSALARARTSRG